METFFFSYSEPRLRQSWLIIAWAGKSAPINTTPPRPPTPRPPLSDWSVYKVGVLKKQIPSDCFIFLLLTANAAARRRLPGPPRFHTSPAPYQQSFRPRNNSITFWGADAIDAPKAGGGFRDGWRTCDAGPSGSAGVRRPHFVSVLPYL